MNRALVIALLCAAGVAYGQPVPPGGLRAVTTDASLTGTGTSLLPLKIRTDCSTNDGLKWNGTTWVCTGGASVTGSGTTNTVAKWTSSSALGNSAITDDGSTILAVIAAANGSGTKAFNIRGAGGAGGVNPVAGTLLTLENASSDVILSLESTTNLKKIAFGNSSSSQDGRIDYDAIARGMRFVTAGTAWTSIDSAGLLTHIGNTALGDATSDTVTIAGVMGVNGATAATNAITVTGPASNTGVRINNASAAQTSSNGSDLLVVPSGTFDTTAGALVHSAARIVSSISRSGGANTLLQMGVSSEVSSGQDRNRGVSSAVTGATATYNMAYYATASGSSGNNYSFFGDDGDLSNDGSTTLGDSTSADLHTINGRAQVNYTENAAQASVLALAFPTGGTLSNYALRGNNSGTYSTSGGALTTYAIRGVHTGTESIGSNVLTNVGGSFSASGADINIALETTGAGVVNFEGLVTATAGGTSPANWTTTGTGDLVSADDLQVTDDGYVASQFSVGQAANPTAINASSPLFPSATPTAEFFTGSGANAFNEAIVIRHNGTDSDAEVRRLGLLLKLSSEGSAGESAKGAGFLAESSSTFSNSPLLYLVAGDEKRFAIASNGTLFGGDSAQTSVNNNLDALTIGNTGTAQTTSNSLIALAHSGTFDTTAGALTSRGVNITMTGARSAGANDLINNALEVTASGGQFNRAIVTTNGDNLLNQSGGNTSIGTSTTNQAKLYVQSTSGTMIDGNNNGTAQTTEGRGTRGRSSGTFNTTSGALNGVALYGSATSTRSAGANDLTNMGVYATASGAQVNYAGYFDAGDVRVNGSTTLGDTAASDTVTIKGDVTVKTGRSLILSDSTDANLAYFTVADVNDLSVQVPNSVGNLKLLNNNGIYISGTGSITLASSGDFDMNAGKFNVDGATGDMTLVGNATIGNAGGDSHVFNGAVDMNHTLNVDGNATFTASVSINSNTFTVASTATTTFGNGPIGINNYGGKHLEFTDEFLHLNAAIAVASTGMPVGGMYQAALSGTATQITDVTGVTTHPGVAVMDTGSTTTGKAAIVTSPNVINQGDGTYIYEATVGFPTLSTSGEEYTATIGFFDTYTAANQVDGCWFSYDRGDVMTNPGTGSATGGDIWQCWCSSNSTRTAYTMNGSNVSDESFTTVNSTVAALTYPNTNVYRLELRMTGSTRAEFYIGINGGATTKRCNINTNIPTGSSRLTGAGLMILKSAGSTARTMHTDQTRLALDLTATR